MTSHETALEAAAQAVWNGFMFDGPTRNDAVVAAKTAIETYLSTLSPDVSGLVERLREMRENWALGSKGPIILTEAADALASLSLQLADDRKHWERMIQIAEDRLFEINSLTERADAAEASLSAAQEENERLQKALEKIERWFGEFPPTGDYWPSGGEMSYAACYGSNGERDFMRGVARKALSTPSKEDKTDAE